VQEKTELRDEVGLEQERGEGARPGGPVRDHGIQTVAGQRHRELNQGPEGPQGHEQRGDDARDDRAKRAVAAKKRGPRRQRQQERRYERRGMTHVEGHGAGDWIAAR
jgi:hypothetical protein